MEVAMQQVYPRREKVEVKKGTFLPEGKKGKKGRKKKGLGEWWEKFGATNMCVEDSSEKRERNAW